VKELFFILALFSTLASAQTPPAYVVLFTHIEDNTPVGILGSVESRQNYSLLRTRLLALATLAKSYSLKWSFQPDWKILEAALLYEDSVLVKTTGGKNVLRYLKEDLSVAIDAHSHENGGYNYTDVAHLLDSLGVGSTTVIGGHIWDPTIPQFQEWDRFRTAVHGTRYPWTLWRGDILMGSGTPNHVNDPEISGVWRPKDRYHYFTDDTAGNIACIGQYKGDLESIEGLQALYRKGMVQPQNMLTSTYSIKPATITQLNGLAVIEDSVFKPLAILRSKGVVTLTDFTSLIGEWKSKFGARAFLLDAKNVTRIELGEPAIPGPVVLHQNYPNPFNPRTAITYRLTAAGVVKLEIFDPLGREVAVLARGEEAAGAHSVIFDGAEFPSGIYFYRLQSNGQVLTKTMILMK
jgi:hypothetical protein